MIKFVFRMILSRFGVGRWVESYKTKQTLEEEEEEVEEEEPSFSKTYITKQNIQHTREEKRNNKTNKK